MSGAKLLHFFILGTVGLVGNLRLYLHNALKSTQFKWGASIYGASLIVLVCGFFPPPDIFSNIILAGPLTLIYLLVLRKMVFSKLRIN